MTKYTRIVFACLLASIVLISVFIILWEREPRGPVWQLHAIGNTLSGADGVKLQDINSDGLLDIATGWEESGITKIYINPGGNLSKRLWPSVIVGITPDVEDAVFADIDGDGRQDVISCCEGECKKLFVHWCPAEDGDLLDPSAWQQSELPIDQQLMFAWPAQVDGKGGVDLIVGAKNQDATLFWVENPGGTRALEKLSVHTITDAGWVMSIWPCDMDDDGDLDVMITDRRGVSAGCRWLENPASEYAQKDRWKSHAIGDPVPEFLSCTISDIDQDGLNDIIAAHDEHKIVIYRRLDKSGDRWSEHIIDTDETIGHPRAVMVADIDQDGRNEIVLTTWQAKDKHGVVCLKTTGNSPGGIWDTYKISGDDLGDKYDRVELIDLDGDGDLDVLTCEENEGPESQGLGVIWYENPVLSR